MKFSTVACFSVFLVAGCGKNESAPTLEAVRFPAVVLFSSSSTRVCREPAELTRMHTNYLKLNSGAPVLIDSEFKIYSLDNFQSTHGGPWLMAHPSEATDVTFVLKAQKSGREAARDLLTRQLEKQTWRDDLESRRKDLAGKQTLLEMIEVLEEER